VNNSGNEFATWYESAYRSVLASVCLFTATQRDAEEATQEAFTRALQRWPSVRQMDSPEGWTCRVAINLAKRGARRARLERGYRSLTRQRRLDMGGEAPSMDDELLVALLALPSRQRQAIVLRYFEDLSQKETAERMGVAPGTAAASLNHARHALKTKLREKRP